MKYGIGVILLLLIVFTVGHSGALAQDDEFDEEIMERALGGVASNGEWDPYIDTVNDVRMVLVPAGCFMMGYDAVHAEEVEQPEHEQCFDKPFWIDRTEVTQSDFERLGGEKARENRFDGDYRPVERITWVEARDFCALRGMRLPTEREWEYAARGPDNLVYPWGSAWKGDKAVWDGSSGGETAAVGSIPAGVSWVGALDMSGNVWEWVSSIFAEYPYNAEDGREDSLDVSQLRVLRGSSWLDADTASFRATYRGRVHPEGLNTHVGFRCARSSD